MGAPGERSSFHMSCSKSHSIGLSEQTWSKTITCLSSEVISGQSGRHPRGELGIESIQNTVRQLYILRQGHRIKLCSLFHPMMGNPSFLPPPKRTAPMAAPRISMSPRIFRLRLFAHRRSGNIASLNIRF